MAHSKVAAKEHAAAGGLSGSGGAVRVPLPATAKQAGGGSATATAEEQQPGRTAVDKEAAQRKAEKEAEAAKRWVWWWCNRCRLAEHVQNPHSKVPDVIEESMWHTDVLMESWAEIGSHTQCCRV